MKDKTSQLNPSAYCAYQSKLRSEKIVWLSPDEPFSPLEFGWKAFNLCLSQVILEQVPLGFAISKTLVLQIAKGEAPQTDLSVLKNYFDQLSNSNRLKIIVRSSSCIENARTNSYAGLFKSINNVRSFSELLIAIKDCYESGQSEQIALYSELRGIVMPSNHLALLVQREVSITQSALLKISQNDFLVESFEGNFADQIKGFGRPKYVFALRNGEDEGALSRRSEEIPNWLRFDKGSLLTEIRRVISSDLNQNLAVLEIALENENLYILQINLSGNSSFSYSNQNNCSFNVAGTALENSETVLGIKGAAMEYFNEIGLFRAPLCVFPPNHNVISIVDTISKKLPSNLGYTVRFSHNTDLGLPRIFLESSNEIGNWITNNRKNGWTTIIHPYINIRSSFEMSISSDSILLEHKPGIWESDNTLEPDVLFINEWGSRVWRYTKPRIAKFVYTRGSKNIVTPPVSLDDIIYWQERVLTIVEILRQDFELALPINLHFVEDADGQWYFLNIRKGFNLNFQAIKESSIHIVKEASDLDNWDKKSPILLKFVSTRGYESRILSIAERLPKMDGFPIIIDFGLLSHPSMILQELGFKLVPAYLYFKNPMILSNYETLDWNNDEGNDPVQRIRQEPAIYADASIRVVKDADPIVENHFLIVSEPAVRSFADGSFKESLTKLLSGQLSSIFYSEGWIFVERGRAQFCTSGFTEAHAHAHLLPANRFHDSTFGDLVLQITAECMKSLADALDTASQSSGEYILIANSQGDTFLRIYPPNHTIEKRLIRTFFLSHM